MPDNSLTDLFDINMHCDVTEPNRSTRTDMVSIYQGLDPDTVVLELKDREIVLTISTSLLIKALSVLLSEVEHE